MPRSPFEYVNPYLEPVYNPTLVDKTSADQYLAHIGLGPARLDFIWSEIGYGMPQTPTGEPDPDALTHEQYRTNCLQRIYRLETERPGAAKRLYHDHGIDNFGRIPMRSLLLQGQPGPFKHRIWAGVVAQDFNGALMDSMFCIDRAHSLLDEPTDLTIDEFYCIDGLIEQLEKRAYEWRHDGQGPPTADVIIFAAHGEPDLLHVYEWFGARAGTLQEIRKTHVQGAVGAAILGIANSDTIVLLDACSAAAGDDNIAAELHDRTGLHVIGATKDVQTDFIRIKPRGGKLDVTPGFYTSKTQGSKYVLHRLPAKHYRPKLNKLN